MSYNTRRTGYGTPQSASVGQRRPAVSNNFVSGGQLTGSQQKPQGQQPQQRPPQQQQSGANFRNQQSQGPQQGYSSQYSNSPQQARVQQSPQSTPVKQEQKPVIQQPQQVQQQQPQQQQPKVQQQQPKVQQQQQPKMQPQQQPKVEPTPVLPGTNPPPPEEIEEMEIGEGGKKRFWNKGNKISKAEKVRRRNLKLSKILQPKNAVMILNELVKGCVYTVEELPVKIDPNQFRGTVTFEEQEFAGTGRTKIGAKNAAAETALKHLVKNKQLCSIKKDLDGDEKMDIAEDESSNQVMPWQHIASFAMFKLFSTWGEDPANLVNRVSASEIGNNTTNGTKPQREPKPAKKLPENPETMNPLMLMHQMLPHAVWEEGPTSGNPPNALFNMIVTVGDNQYSGTASSKKAAKKLGAFAACHDMLKVTYPPDVWAPTF